MTNHLVGLVYQRIIESVVEASTTDFEESGVSSTTLQELQQSVSCTHSEHPRQLTIDQQEWQAKLSARGVAEMPWDPKPQPQAQPPPQPAPNGLSSGSYSATYDQAQTASANGNSQVKTEPALEQQQFHGLPPAPYAQNGVPPPQGGFARAQQLVQAQYGNAIPRNGLALPGQQARPQSMPMPGNAQPGTAANDHFQQQQQMAMQRQQQALKHQNSYQQQSQHPQQQQQPQHQSAAPIKTESEPANYGQTDGAGDDLEQWRAMLAERRAVGAEQMRQADRMMRDQVMKMSDDLQNGLMLPLEEQPAVRRHKQTRRTTAKASRTSKTVASSSGQPSIPQLDGEDDDDDDEDTKAGIKDEDDDENAINSDLDDSDEDAQGNMGEDDDEEGDAILCTYDKVQRVKNKWKCTLKDGVMIADGKDYVFHKGMGEFEW